MIFKFSDGIKQAKYDIENCKELREMIAPLLEKSRKLEPDALYLIIDISNEEGDNLHENMLVDEAFRKASTCCDILELIVPVDMLKKFSKNEIIKICNYVSKELDSAEYIVRTYEKPCLYENRHLKDYRFRTDLTPYLNTSNRNYENFHTLGNYISSELDSVSNAINKIKKTMKTSDYVSELYTVLFEVYQLHNLYAGYTKILDIIVYFYVNSIPKPEHVFDDFARLERMIAEGRDRKNRIIGFVETIEDRTPEEIREFVRTLTPEYIISDRI